ncbi:hypothetical protein KDA14_05085, partial [Candidatus Saccharibacteria bacterium]|nr:hypothetical protein [Candidatus Saccharibacteria bacterium]
MLGRKVQKIRTRIALALSAVVLTVSGGGMSLAILGSAHAAPGAVIYDSIPSPLPGNVASLGYAATSTSQFGDRVTLDGASGTAPSVTVLMSSWGCETGHWNLGDCVTTPGATFSQELTLNVYNVDAGGAVGSMITSKTQTFDIPYRPSADNTHCTAGDAGKWFDGTVCNNGKAAEVTFQLSGLSSDLPTDVVFAVQFNTTSHGPSPVGTGAACYSSPGGCPYDSLNVGIPTGQTVSVGSDNDADVVYWDTTYPGYTAGLKADTGWSPNGTVSLRVVATSTPDKVEGMTILQNGNNIGCDASVNQRAITVQYKPTLVPC